MNNRSSQDFNRRLNRSDKPLYQLAQESRQLAPGPGSCAPQVPEPAVPKVQQPAAPPAPEPRAPAAARPPRSRRATPAASVPARAATVNLQKLVPALQKARDAVARLIAEEAQLVAVIRASKEQLIEKKKQLAAGQNQLVKLEQLYATACQPQPASVGEEHPRHQTPQPGTPDSAGHPLVTADKHPLLGEGHRETLMPQSRAYPLPANYEPSEACYQQLLHYYGVPADYARGQVVDFKLYWHSTGEARKGWDYIFIKHVRYTWDRQRNEQQKRQLQPRQPTHEELTDRSWIGQYDFDPDGDLDP